MATIIVGKEESLDSAIKRFKRKCADQGVVSEIKSRQEYVKPSVAAKAKHKLALQRAQREKRIREKRGR